MSGVAIMRALLVASARVTALVPVARIFSGDAPQGTAMPAIGIRQISGSEEGTTARNLPTKMMRERVQVTVLVKVGSAPAYTQLKAIQKATALGPGVFTGQAAGYKVISVLPWGENPEIPPGDDGIYEQSRDFMVTFIDAN